MNVTYREMQKKDGDAVKKLINQSFALHSYVSDPGVLKSFLDLYLQSCLAQQTYCCVAEQDGQIIGVIMGQAKTDYRVLTHLRPTLATAYHGLAMQLKAALHGERNTENKEMHRIYDALLAHSGQQFDGVLTLFAISSASRGLGIGKELLRCLTAYLSAHGTRRIYLHTDSTCNYGFYEHQGLTRLGEQSMCMTRSGKPFDMDIYLYGYEIH